MIVLLDPDGKRFLVRLSRTRSLHHHRGAVRHADVIGQPEGIRVRSSQGHFFVVVRPRLMDYVLDMPRHSGIVYPKDAAHLLAWADIAPGQRVLESGVGSGALTLALLRAVGERGQVIGYEQRADFIELALSNVHAFGSDQAGNLLVRERDIYEGSGRRRPGSRGPRPGRAMARAAASARRAANRAAGWRRTTRRSSRPASSSRRCARPSGTSRSKPTRS